MISGLLESMASGLRIEWQSEDTDTPRHLQIGPNRFLWAMPQSYHAHNCPQGK
jgi:hypothetical protein